MKTDWTLAGSETPTERMLTLSVSHLFLVKALALAAKFRIADHIQAGATDLETLARRTETKAPFLYRLLRACAAAGVFAEDANGRFSNTPLSDTLRSDVPNSVRATVEIHGEPWHWEAFGGLEHTMRTGEPAWVKVHGENVYEYFVSHPEHARLFDEDQAEFCSREAPHIAAAFDFGKLKSICDVGGGAGLMMEVILSKYPELRGAVYDEAMTVARAKERLANHPVFPRMDFIGGNFLESAPKGFDAYIMRWVIHCFIDDEVAAKILRNCATAMNPGGKVFVVNGIIPKDNSFYKPKLMDVQIMLIDGIERTEEQYRALFARAGLRFEKAFQLPSGEYLMMAERA